MLALATVGFAVNFCAWALLSPLGPRFKEQLALSSFQQALVVACRWWSARSAGSRSARSPIGSVDG